MNSSNLSTTSPSSFAEETNNLVAGLGYLVLGIVLGVALIAGRPVLYGIAGGMSTVVTLLPLSYAFAAGMVATVNPCGILLVPSLVAYYLNQDGRANAGPWRRAERALELGVMSTIGFVAIFALVGVVVGLGGSALANAFPIGGIGIGVVLAFLGVYLALSGRTIGILAASRSMGYVRLSGLRSMFAFGVAYAVASLACTLPIFLVVVGSALAASGVASAALQFISYALGMGLVLTAVILATTFFQGFVRGSLRQIAPHVHRISASFLLGAGIFLINYWLSAR